MPYRRYFPKGLDAALVYENIFTGRNTAKGRSLGVALAFYSLPK